MTFAMVRSASTSSRRTRAWLTRLGHSRILETLIGELTIDDFTKVLFLSCQGTLVLAFTKQSTAGNPVSEAFLFIFLHDHYYFLV